MIKSVPIANDPASWLQTVWDTLHSARQLMIPEGDEDNDRQWNDLCTAMAWITEELGVDPEELE